MINRIKAISLIILVISSVILTIVLWYSTPPYDEQTNPYIPASYIGESNYVPKKYLYQLTSPPYLIYHRQGKHQLITGKQANLFAELNSNLYRAKLDGFELFTPTANDWKQLFLQTDGIELSFFQDVSIGQLDAFCFHLLENEPVFHQIHTVSRVWVFTNPSNNRQEIWFISDQDGKVIRANTTFSIEQWTASIDKINRVTPLPTLEAIPTDGINPAGRSNQQTPFARILYLPTQPIHVPALTYADQSISIDNMKGWLFQGNEIEPIELSKNESVYMDNNQILTFYKQQSYMVYVDNVHASESTTSTIGNEIDMINSKFMSKHHGWTGDFLLDSISQQENEPLYTFRLINQGLPVYWQQATSKSVYLDTIQLQAGTGVNTISKYIRSLHYLVKQPSQQISATLPNKATVMKQLAAKHITLATVKRIMPVYTATSIAKGRIQLTPLWRVEQRNGEVLWIGDVD